MPSFVSVNPKTVSAEATTTSATAQRPIPPPSAAPWTRAMTGAGHRSMAVNIACIAAASRSFSSSDRPIAERIHSTSAPAQKTEPSPARTTPRSALTGSRANASNVERSPAISSALNALRTSGRASVTRANGAVPLDAQSAHAPPAPLMERIGHRTHLAEQGLLQPHDVGAVGNVDRRGRADRSDEAEHEPGAVAVIGLDEIRRLDLGSLQLGHEAALQLAGVATRHPDADRAAHRRLEDRLVACRGAVRRRAPRARRPRSDTGPDRRDP